MDYSGGLDSFTAGRLTKQSDLYKYWSQWNQTQTPHSLNLHRVQTSHKNYKLFHRISD